MGSQRVGHDWAANTTDTLFKMENILFGSSYIQIISFSSVQFSRSVVSDSATTWTATPQASLSITNSWSLLKLMTIESVMPSNHLILCYPLLLPPSIFPSIRDFSNESTLRIRWPKYWSFSFSISLSSEYSGLISFRIDWLDLWLIGKLALIWSIYLSTYSSTIYKIYLFC